MSKYNGPQFNNTKRNFTTRDNLGIENVANALSADLCPIVNTVTPRPFYWVFITWAYWKFYQIYGYIKDSEVTEFYKRINYFIALGNLIVGNNSVGSFTGITNIKWSGTDSSFSYNDNYIKGSGAIGYYPPGLEQLHLVIKQNIETGEIYPNHVITPKAIKLAEAFEQIISKTDFCKEYLLQESVTKSVLIDLGKTIQIDLNGFAECRKLLNSYLFDPEQQPKLNKCKEYLLYIKNALNIEVDTAYKCRRIFYDEFSVKGNHKSIPSNLNTLSEGWEIITGRQYLTTALEIIWQFMLNQLDIPMTKSDWVYCVLERSGFSFDVQSPLLSVINNYNYNGQQIEELLSKERSAKDNHSLERGFAIMVSVYNRFKDREYDPQISGFFHRDKNSVPLHTIFDSIEKHIESSIEEFFRYIMTNYLINQHLQTAFAKLLEDRDGYYVEILNDRYLRSHTYSWGIQSNRMVQLYSVMHDLEVI